MGTWKLSRYRLTRQSSFFDFHIIEFGWIHTRTHVVSLISTGLFSLYLFKKISLTAKLWNKRYILLVFIHKVVLTCFVRDTECKCHYEEWEDKRIYQYLGLYCFKIWRRMKMVSFFFIITHDVIIWYIYQGFLFYNTLILIFKYSCWLLSGLRLWLQPICIMTFIGSTILK